jgi:ribosomal protein S18 acetylase RimI-like enzyme
LTPVTTILRMSCELDREFPSPAWPEGISVRTYQPRDGEAVHALLDEAYRGWDAAYTPVAHAHWLTAMPGDSDFDANLWFLAERDGALAGCALHWASGWLKDLAVREDERGRGLGRALVLAGIDEYVRRGVKRVGLKVDAENPTGALALYESIGFAAETLDPTWARTR